MQSNKPNNSSHTELQVVIDEEGIKCVRVLGPSGEHEAGHKLYFRIRDLLENLDKAIQERLSGREEDEKSKFNA